MTTQLTPEDYKFLKNLDRTLHYTFKSSPVGCNCFSSSDGENKLITKYHEESIDKSITKKQLEKVLGIYKKTGNLLIYPKNSFDFSEIPVLKIDQIILTSDYLKRLMNEQNIIVQKEKDADRSLSKVEFFTKNLDNNGDHKLSYLEEIEREIARINPAKNTGNKNPKLYNLANLLTIRKEQLPSGNYYEDLLKHCEKPENIESANTFGITNISGLITDYRNEFS